jgi:hypothetical protein
MKSGVYKSMMGSIRTDVVKSKNVSTLNLTAHLFTSNTLNNQKNNEVSYRAYLAIFTPQRRRRAPTPLVRMVSLT